MWPLRPYAVLAWLKINFEGMAGKVSKKFCCDSCGEEFESDWSDDAAEAEALELWGEIEERDRAIVCDPCFRKMVLIVEEATGH